MLWQAADALQNNPALAISDGRQCTKHIVATGTHPAKANGPGVCNTDSVTLRRSKALATSDCCALHGLCLFCEL